LGGGGVNGVRQAWLVAARELRERGRSRVFLVSVLLMLVGAAGAIVLPALLDTGPETKDVALTGSAPAELAPALRAQAEAVDTTIRVHRYDTLAHGEAAVRGGEADVLVVDARQLEWPKRADEQLQALVTGAIQLVTVRERAAAAGISPDEILAVLAPAPVSNVELGQVAGRSPGDENAAFIMTLVLFGAISTFGAMVLSGVVEEKSSRTVEVLLARMPARSLLAGKIVGIGLLGLATRTEDASSVAGPVTIVLVLSFMAAFATFGSIDTTWARLVSWIPVTAPMAMPFRVAMGAATWWDLAIALVLTLASIWGLVVLGGRIYTRAILNTGASLTLRDAWREVAAPARSRTSG
jgi:ABC-2 type transport system permease protein